MSNLIQQKSESSQTSLPPIENGDHLGQPAFHKRYEAMPSQFRAELIGGRVFVHSRTTAEHGQLHAIVMGWLGTFVEHTPGVDFLNSPTIIMGPESEPQPDAALIVEPDCGGQTSIDDGYIVGPPELIVEVASSSQAYDLHEKREDYQRAGVREYVVVMIRDHEVRWFELDDNGRFQVRQIDDDAIYRSRAFPGLWLRPLSLLEQNLTDLMATLREGLADASYAAFIEQLAAQRGKK